jgi:hypothetical protein
MSNMDLDLSALDVPVAEGSPRRDVDPIKARQKRLKLSQKMSEAIVNYATFEDWIGTVETPVMLLDALAVEQKQLQDEIKNLVE